MLKLLDRLFPPTGRHRPSVSPDRASAAQIPPDDRTLALPRVRPLTPPRVGPWWVLHEARSPQGVHRS